MNFVREEVLFLLYYKNRYVLFRDKNFRKGVTMMLMATFFWSFMGISNRFLNQIHLGSLEVAFIRTLSASLVTTVVLFLTNRSLFKINFKGLLFCVFYGVLNYTIGISLYSVSVERIPIAVATVLMFSNPVWVTLFSKIFFGDKVGLKKILLISTCIFGCMCIIDIFTTGGKNLDIIGVLAGIGNGMTFALQIVLPRFVERSIKKETILLYGFWTGTICLSFFVNIGSIVQSFSTSSNPMFYVLNALCIGVLGTYCANTFYVKSTKYIGTSLPSMMVALEPIFAAVLAFFIFAEQLKYIQFLGAFIVVMSVIMLEIRFDFKLSLDKVMDRISISKLVNNTVIKKDKV